MSGTPAEPVVSIVVDNRRGGSNRLVGDFEEYDRKICYFSTSRGNRGLATPRHSLRALNASAQTNTATDSLIDRVVALTEHGDPAAMEKTTAGYQIDASRKFNPGIPDDTWGSIRADVNDIISNKIKPGYGEQALLTRHFVESAKFSDDELRHLITIMQDPVMQRWGIAMRDSSTTAYMAKLSQQVNNQMWMVVSIVLRRHGLQTTDTSTTAKQSH